MNIVYSKEIGQFVIVFRWLRNKFLLRFYCCEYNIKTANVKMFIEILLELQINLYRKHKHLYNENIAFSLRCLTV